MNYREHSALNHSKLKWMSATPLDFYERFIAKTIIEKSTPAMEFGTLFHMYALQPYLAHEKVAVTPDFGDLRTKVNKEAKIAWENENIDKIHITEEMHLQLNAMVHRLHSHKEWQNILQTVKDDAHDAQFIRYRYTVQPYEKEIYFTYKDIECKAQLDINLHAKKNIYDIKTVDNIDKDKFIRSIETYGYDTQAAFYMQAAVSEFKELIAINKYDEHDSNNMYRGKFEDWTYTLIACCKNPPYHVRFYKLPMAYLLRAKRKNEQRLELYKQCMLWNDWPGYGEDVEELEIPSWFMKE